MSNDDDFLTGTIPAPDAEPSSGERAHAKTFADLVDKTLAGRTPGVMSADDRALLEVATVIRATKGAAPLAADRQSSIVEAALRKAVGDVKPSTIASGAVVPITRARAPKAPWIVASASLLVAAAAVLLWLRAPHVVVDHRPTATLPENLRSRPTDSLIGPIPHEHGDTTARIDTIFADRLDGYRELRLRGGTR
ncbi:MAG TPA: hypothetical protein VGC41_06765 [Kofleriaceae bacterium]